MNIPGLQQALGKLISDNTAMILTTGGVIGTVLTATLAARAGSTAALKIDMEVRERTAVALANDPDADDIELTWQEKAKIAAPVFIPPVLIGLATIGSIVMANRVQAKHAAMLAGAYALAEQRHADFKERALAKLTGPKRDQVAEEIAEDRLGANPPPQMIVIESGKVLCYDMYTDRYFESTAENIRRACNKINEELFQTQYASLSNFYDHVGLMPTGFSNDVGWNMATTGACDVKITSHKSPDDKPCLAFDFIVPPRPEYQQNY